MRLLIKFLLTKQILDLPRASAECLDNHAFSVGGTSVTAVAASVSVLLPCPTQPPVASRTTHGGQRFPLTPTLSPPFPLVTSRGTPRWFWLGRTVSGEQRGHLAPERVSSPVGKGPLGLFPRIFWLQSTGLFPPYSLSLIHSLLKPVFQV